MRETCCDIRWNAGIPSRRNKHCSHPWASSPCTEMLTLLLFICFVLQALAFPLTPRAANKTSYVIGSQNATDVDDGVCAPLTLLFARGTIDPGNLGQVIGPPLCGNLSVLLNGNVALQGVPYPATIEGIAVQGWPGGEMVTELAEKVSASRKICQTAC